MDELKKWAEENKGNTEIYSFDKDKSWEVISDQLDSHNPSRRTWIAPVLKWAATIVLLVMAGGYFLLDNSSRNPDGFALHEVSPELADTEYFYSTQLNEKLQLLKASHYEIDPAIIRDLDVMANIYKDLMKDLKDDADNEEVIEAMIENYRIRLAMLERILEKINEEDQDFTTDENAI